MDITFFNETTIFEWAWNFWMKILKLIKLYKTEGKSKLSDKLIIIESKTY